MELTRPFPRPLGPRRGASRGRRRTEGGGGRSYRTACATPTARSGSGCLESPGRSPAGLSMGASPRGSARDPPAGCAPRPSSWAGRETRVRADATVLELPRPRRGASRDGGGRRAEEDARAGRPARPRPLAAAAAAVRPRDARRAGVSIWGRETRVRADATVLELPRAAARCFDGDAAGRRAQEDPRAGWTARCRPLAAAAAAARPGMLAGPPSRFRGERRALEPTPIRARSSSSRR